MTTIRKTILPVLLATLWVLFSEFLRNEILFKQLWVEHYKELGLVFPSKPINGVIWGIWSLFYATFIFIISKKYKLLQTTILSWFVGFVLMWLVLGNMGFLPYKLLYAAVPLSLLETFVAVIIIYKTQKKEYNFK